MKSLLTFTTTLVLFMGLAIPIHAQEPPDDPFGGGFPIGYGAEIFTMGTQNDSLHGWGYNWDSISNTIVLMGDGSFPESYQCGDKRDFASADFDGDYGDELVMAWNLADGGVFIGIPTIDTIQLKPDPAGWHLADPPIASGVLYATPVLSDVLGEVRVVAGNFYADRAMEFVLAYLAADSTVTLTVFDVDSLTLIPAAMATISDQAVNTALPELQQFGAVSRFDVATGDFDGDGLDEIALIVSDPAQSPATDLMVRIYDYDPSSHALNPKPSIPYAANSDVDHSCLRNVLMETGNFESDSLDEIAILDSWSRADVDSSRVGTLHTVKLTTAMTGIAASQTQSLPSCSWHNDAGLNGTVRVMTTYNGELIVGGTFTAAGGLSANNIASWDGTRWKPLGGGVDTTVEALEVYEDDLIVGGYFTEAGGVPASHLARWDGSSWEEFGGGATNNVFDLLATNSVSAGSLFACGDFTTIGGVSAKRIARWDGSAWHTVGSDGGLNARAHEMMELGGRIVVTGQFQWSTPESHYIASWLPSNPNAWSHYGKGFYYYGYALADIHGALIGGGEFTQVWGKWLGIPAWIGAGRIAWWSGDAWNAIDDGLNNLVHDLRFNPADSNLYISGRFTTADNIPANRIARWHWAIGGGTWHALGAGVTGTGTVEVVDMCFYGSDSDLIAGGWFDHAGGVDVCNIARWHNSQWHPLSDSLPPMFSMGLAVGRFDSDSELDDIAIAACRSESGYVRQYLRVYGVDTLSAPLTLSEKGETNISGDWNVEELARSRRLIAVDDITGDGQADLAVLSSQFPSRIEIYEPCNSTFDPMPQAGSWNSRSVNLTQLVLADLDTGTVTIGPPKAYHLDSLIQPLAIINAPPVHYDILDDTIWDVSNRYPLPPPEDYDTYVKYHNSTNFQITTETEMHRDWGISTGLEAWISAGGSGVSTHLTAEYGEHFSQQGGYSERVTVGYSRTARDDDQVHVVTVSYDILEYPVFHSGELVGHVLVASPSQLSSGWSAPDPYKSFMPDHEVENILSYPCLEDILSNPMKASGVIGNMDFFEMVPGSESEWFLAHQTFQSSSVTESWDASAAAGGTVTVGIEFQRQAQASIPVFGGLSVGTITSFSAGISASIDGYYDVGQISTFSTSFSETDSLHVQMGLINSAGGYSGNRQYKLIPYAYWANNGALVMDYVVEPVTNQPGQDPTWWQIHYSVPDPAFILPRRFDNEKYGSSDPEETRHETKEIFFFPAYQPSPGDSIAIGARVHNFSLVDILDPVAVSFYLGDPDNGGMILHDKNSGDSIFYTRDTSGALVDIDAQRSAFASMVWQVPEVGSISGCQRIWALIDPLDEITPEVHDNDDWATNNKGWKLLYVNTDDICIDRDGDGWEESTFRCHTCPHPQQGEDYDNCPTVYNPDQTDSNGDGIGDACQWVCGDVDSDQSVNMLDILFLIAYLYKGGPTPNQPDAADVNNDGGINMLDILYLIAYLYKAGPEPVCP